MISGSSPSPPSTLEEYVHVAFSCALQLHPMLLLPVALLPLAKKHKTKKHKKKKKYCDNNPNREKEE